MIVVKYRRNLRISFAPLFWVKNIMRAPIIFIFPSIDYIMNLQEVSSLLNIDFTAMELQSGFNKLSKNQ